MLCNKITSPIFRAVATHEYRFDVVARQRGRALYYTSLFMPTCKLLSPTTFSTYDIISSIRVHRLVEYTIRRLGCSPTSVRFISTSPPTGKPDSAIILASPAHELSYRIDIMPAPVLLAATAAEAAMSTASTSTIAGAVLPAVQKSTIAVLSKGAIFAYKFGFRFVRNTRIAPIATYIAYKASGLSDSGALSGIAISDLVEV